MSNDNAPKMEIPSSEMSPQFMVLLAIAVALAAAAGLVLKLLEAAPNPWPL